MIDFTILVACKGKTKEEILGSPLVLSTRSNTIICNIGEADSEETETVGDPQLTIINNSRSDWAYARNLLINRVSTKLFMFAGLGTALADDYDSAIDSRISQIDKYGAICFGIQTKSFKRCKPTELFGHGIEGIVFNTESVTSRELIFPFSSLSGEGRESVDCFLHDASLWPSTVYPVAEPIFTKDPERTFNQGIQSAAYLNSHRFGILWWFPLLKKSDSNGNVSLKQRLSAGLEGHRAYLRKELGADAVENRPNNVLALVISIISMVGIAVQSILSLLVTFTETQYIPIWLSLLFLVIFVILFAIFVAKVTRKAPLFIATVITAIATGVGCITTLVCLGVNGYLATFGAFICVTLIFGLLYCFLYRVDGKRLKGHPLSNL